MLQVLVSCGASSLQATAVYDSSAFHSMPSVAIQMSVEEACSTLLRLLRPAPRTQRELTQIVLYLDLLRQMQPMWLHTAGGLRCA